MPNHPPSGRTAGRLEGASTRGIVGRHPFQQKMDSNADSFASPVEVFAQVWEYFMELVCSLSIPIFLPDGVDVSIYLRF
ncbi:hypothetical protein PoB_001185500 [Plakobranchus ocellatus]|uniref:Uncharacterized protein n=1 Tax=Plakobranchus ocellatus TaxID=259542 RepID=A0AAV3YRG2_9GAST|nr:hypothetical protein PoB_001185500 [Plakobranchus ocellatus]